MDKVFIREMREMGATCITKRQDGEGQMLERALKGEHRYSKAPRRERAWHSVAIAQSGKREGREEGGEMEALGSP